MHALRLVAPVAALLLVGCSGGATTTVTTTAAPTPAASSPTLPTPAATSPARPATATPGAPSPSPSPSAAPVATVTRAVRSGPGPCRTSALRVTLGPAEGAAGSTFVPLVLRNTGRAPCTLDGHPGVSTVASTGRQVGHAAGRDGRPRRVLLAPGASAHATLREIEAGAYDPAACRPVPVAGLRVYPPDQTASVVVPSPGTACADPSVVLLTVGAVEAGAGP